MISPAIKNSFESLIVKTGERLKALGYSRQGSILRILKGDNCGIVDFQRSTKNSTSSLLFTINLAVVCGKLLQAEEIPLKRARISDAHIRERIGMLLANPCDRWWELQASTDSDAFSREIIELIVSKGVPFIENYLDSEAIIALWESGRSPGLTDVQRCDFLAILKEKRKGVANGPPR